MSLPQGKEKLECVYSYMMLKLIQIMVLRTRISLLDLLNDSEAEKLSHKNQLQMLY